MAGEIIVTAEQLKNQANALRELNERYQGMVSDLKAEEVALSDMWEGEAKNAFRSAFSRDADNMYRFYNAVNKYADVLDQMAAKYSQAEYTNTEIANKRSY